jgi:hypothetical protein
MSITIEDSNPQPTYDEISALCTTGKTASRLTGILLTFLTDHFSLPSYIKIPELQQYVWTPEGDTPDEKNLIIKPNYSMNWKNIQTRPAIILKRNPIQSVKISIDDYVSPPEFKGDGEHYAKIKKGGHTIYCIATSGHIAELLSEEVADEILEFSPKIREDLSFNTFEQTVIGDVSKVEEHNTHFVVPITLEYSWTHTWKLIPISPILKVYGPEITLEDN